MTNPKDSDQWDGTDIEPTYARYHDPGYLINTRNRDTEQSEDDRYYRCFAEGDRFS